MHNSKRLIVSQKSWYRQKLWQVVLIVLSLIFLTSVAWLLDKRGVLDLPFFPDNSSSDGEINYGPPTEEEKEETERFKSSLEGQSQNKPATDSAGQKQSVTPVISSWGQQPGGGAVEVSGYIVGVIESEGTCILRLTNGSQVVSASQSSTANAQNTSCGFIKVDRSQLSPGNWEAILEYSSPTAQGKSQAQEIRVQ